eukprot:TRINITY_DN847_c0_g1_i2.p1 TRINITY_DN847_c0_g1~~TRINITY_DN847_c0_g1_i2.p1  ORF type:complete len:197 (+),score=29.48 TRINITY_DN847_c0_g1_i2:105-695(+)
MEDLREFDPLQQRKKGKHSVEHGAVKTPKPETFEHVIDDHQHDASHSFYDYDSMLERLFEVFEEITVDYGIKTIEPPQIGRIGKKVIWTNFQKTCKTIDREIPHVKSFVEAELGSVCTLGAENKLVIRGRFKSSEIQSILKKYIIEYVKCRTCNGPNTKLKKMNRNYFVTCDNCNASNCVLPVKSIVSNGGSNNHV